MLLSMSNEDELKKKEIIDVNKSAENFLSDVY